MKVGNFFNITGVLIGARLIHKRTPLAVTWALLYRCNQRCRYCRIWENQSNELDTSQIFGMIDTFKRAGTRWITFTGGEPLLRNDLGQILKYAKEKDIFLSLSSNGSLVPEKIKELKYADRIKLSLDGPEEIHDNVRQEGSFRKVIKSIEVSRSASIPVCLECVISKYNVESLDHVIEIARQYNLKVLFQPATKKLLGSEHENNICAPIVKYKVAIDYLIERKKSGAPIYNSLPGLMHLSKWPDDSLILCSAGILSCRVEADGRILVCARAQSRSASLHSQYKKLSVEQQLKELRLINNCKQCWCSSSIEFNLISSFNIRAINSMLKNLK